MEGVAKLKNELENKIKTYITDSSIVSNLMDACDYAIIHHEGQLRKSGEPYIIHPINVAIILCDLNVGPHTIAAGLMHDLIEDTEVSFQDIEMKFGYETASLVDGVTKIGMMKFSTASEAEIENQKKLIIGMIRDVRVIIIKLADRLHNMRTLNNLTVEKQKKIANDTLEIFAPVAHRLGMYNIKSELEDLALKYSKPDIYDQIVENINAAADNLENSLLFVQNKIGELLDGRKILYEMSGRVKSVYSIYKKIVNKNKSIDEIYDIMALRIIVDNVNECYITLGIIHELFRPIPHRFKDYIAMPKPNMYQALHTTIIGTGGQPYEIQIKTHQMHDIAEQGIASHWNYKENKSITPQQEQHEIEEKYEWFRNMMSFNENEYNSEEYMEAIKRDVFNTSVYVFTPKGSTIHLPDGATPIDFAYKIHTEVGHKMVGAKVNGAIVPIGTKLESGDVIEILTNSNSLGPSIDWLDIAGSSHAKNKIRQFFRQSNRIEMIENGNEKLKKVFSAKKISFNNFMRSPELTEIVKAFKVVTIDEVLAGIGGGSFKAEDVLERYLLLLQNSDDDIDWIIKKNYKSEKGVIVPGVDNLPLDLANCCKPIPGDDIVGYISKTGVIRVHRSDCPNIINTNNEERSIKVIWVDDTKGFYETYIKVQCTDRTSLISDILKVFGAVNSNITEMSSKTTFSMHTMNLTILVKSKEDFRKLIDNIKKVKGVLAVERVIK
ncbi:MAG: RelA/SpoT family protein [Bacilli bacterium]